MKRVDIRDLQVRSKHSINLQCMYYEAAGFNMSVGDLTSELWIIGVVTSCQGNLALISSRNIKAADMLFLQSGGQPLYESTHDHKNGRHPRMLTTISCTRLCGCAIFSPHSRLSHNAGISGIEPPLPSSSTLYI